MASEVANRWVKGPGDPIMDNKPISAPRSETNANLLRAARGGNIENIFELLDSGAASIEACNPNGLNALHLAAKEGHANIVAELLARHSVVDAASKKGNTALHIASLAGHEEIVKLLVQAGARVNVQSHSGFTPLYMAAQEDHAEVVKYLLDHGANQALATEDGFTALSVALQQGHNKVVAILMENDSRNKVKLPALHVAAKRDDVQAATLLLQPESGSGKKAVSVNDATKSGFTPLHIAAHYGSLNVATVLLNHGADVEFKARNAVTPLHVASKWGRTSIVTLLTDVEANLECKTRDSLTPLHCSSRSGHDQCVSRLLDKGANVSAKTKNGLTALHMAAQGDHVECARILLQYRAQIDDVTMDYLTPLHLAAHCGNVKVAKLLLDNGCEVNARALNGFTPLHVACKKNRIKVIELLLRYGALVESTTESGLTSLHVASFMGHITVVNYLLENGANTETQTVRGETALHLAARANQTEIMRILLRNGAQVDARAKELQTPLHISSRLGSVDGVQLLLQHGANRDATTKDLYTPLHIAVKEGHEDVVQLLLSNGAKQDIATKKGFTPLHIAAKYGNVPITKILLSKNAQPNIEGKNGLTPLHVATHYNSPDVAQLLLEHGASPHAAARNGYTPLHIAAKKNQVEIAKLLLDNGAKPNAESKNGYTPLHLASQEGHTEIVELLLQRKADVNCKARNGLTPMHLAAQEDQVPVAEILVAYGSQIDPQTKAGYTPLHTACHFGQLEMIRFLLEHGASVGAVTKLGYTPLHQAAQQGHVLVINLLLKYKADPNALSGTGQTPLSIAQRLGYISVVEILKHITEKEVPIDDADDYKYKVVFPETMQEAPIDSDDEGGDGTLMADRSYHYLTVDDAKEMRYDASSPTSARADPRGADLFAFETLSGRQSTLSSVGARDPIHEELRYVRANTEEADPVNSRYGSITPSSHRDGPGYPSSSHDDYFDGRAVTPGPAEDDLHYIWRDDTRLSDFMTPTSPGYTLRDEDGQYRSEPQRLQGMPARAVSEQMGPEDDDSVLIRRSGQPYSNLPPTASHQQDSQATLLGPGGSKADLDSRMYGSMYSDTSFASTFNPDNVSIDRHPVMSGFLVSFLVDARGGAMKGCRHSGVRIIVPPGKVCMPTRITCKLIRTEKLSNPPPLMEAEALATRVLQMGPAGTKFTGNVLIEVPHYAALHGQEREIVILRSENGATWHEHSTHPTNEDIQKALGTSGFHGEDLESAEELYHGRVARILTSDFPRYFAVVTRIRQETKHVGPERTIISSTVAPQVQILIPPKAVTKPIKVGLQAHPVNPDVVARASNDDQRYSVSPIVTIEPRHRKFHEPITVTIPLPPNSTLRGKGKGKKNNTTNEAAGLRLLCSITGGTAPSSWEDLTGTIPLTLVDDCVSFATNVSARFWVIEVPPQAANSGEPQRLAKEIWHEAVAVPMMSKFVVFAKRRTMAEARLRMFCMTDDRMDKTLESQQRFVEIARSKDVEVMEGRPQYVELAGNLSSKAGEHPAINFRAFRENRTAVTVRLKDIKGDPSGQIVFVPLGRLPDVRPPQPTCVLNLTLPEASASVGGGLMNGVGGMSSDSGGDTDHAEMLAALDAAHHQVPASPIKQEGISKAELRLTDIADALGSDWVPLARHFGMSQQEIVGIRKDYNFTGEQALVVLHKWIERNEGSATGNELERVLQRIGREDIVDKCMRNLEPVVDDKERKDALSQIDPNADLLKKADQGNVANAPSHSPDQSQPSSQNPSQSQPSSQNPSQSDPSATSSTQYPNQSGDRTERISPEYVPEDRNPLFDDPSIKHESKPKNEEKSRDKRSKSKEKEAADVDAVVVPECSMVAPQNAQPPSAPLEESSSTFSSGITAAHSDPVSHPNDDSYNNGGTIEELRQDDEPALGLRVYTDVYEEPPVVETDVQEFEETLPDGSVVTRKITTTSEKQVVMHRVTMEGPEDSLEASEAKEVLLREAGVGGEGEEERDGGEEVEEYEETLPDGSIVTRRVTRKTHMKTVVMYDENDEGTEL